jgi:hypothetical protein
MVQHPPRPTVIVGLVTNVIILLLITKSTRTNGLLQIRPTPKLSQLFSTATGQSPNVNTAKTGTAAFGKTNPTSSSLFTENIECQTDDNGLRGLKWKHPRSRGSKSGGKGAVACRLPRSSIIVADRQGEDETPSEALTRTVLSHLLTTMDPTSTTAATTTKKGNIDQASAAKLTYFENLPTESDLSLATMGAKWEPWQLERLAHHAPTIDFFKALYRRRERTIQKVLLQVPPPTNSNMNATLNSEQKTNSDDESIAQRNAMMLGRMAGWAYDLVATRSLRGHFGHRGILRSLVSAWAASFTVAAVVPLLLAWWTKDSLSAAPVVVVAQTTTASTTVVLGASLVPLVLSSMALVYFFMVSLSTKQSAETAMMPFIDLANHKSGRNEMIFEYSVWKDAIVWKKKVVTKKHDTTTTTTPTTPGLPNTDNVEENDRGELDDEWITFDYGGTFGTTNDALLGIYGFVEHDNPNDQLQLLLPAPQTSGGKRSRVTIGRLGQVLPEQQYPVWDEDEDGTSTATLEDIVIAARMTRTQFLMEPDMLRILPPPTTTHKTDDNVRKKDDTDSVTSDRVAVLTSSFSASETTTTHDYDDAVDMARATAAKMWRYEKVRLLDEFLAVHDCDAAATEILKFSI